MRSKPARYRGPAHAHARGLLVKLPLSADVGRAPLWATSSSAGSESETEIIPARARPGRMTVGGRAAWRATPAPGSSSKVAGRLPLLDQRGTQPGRAGPARETVVHSAMWGTTFG